jgi:hypothetical protein
MFTTWMKRIYPSGFGWACPIQSMDALNLAWFFSYFICVLELYGRNIGLMTHQHVLCKKLNG